MATEQVHDTSTAISAEPMTGQVAPKTVASATPPNPAQGLPRRENQVTLIVVASLVAVAYLPLLWSHFGQLWARPHYQFFPIVIIGAAILAWKELGGITSLQPGTTAISWGLLGWSWFLLAVAEFYNSPPLSAYAFLFLVLAVIYTAGGRSLVLLLLPAWIFLWQIARPPFRLDQDLVSGLQTLATQLSSAVLDLFRIYHVVSGNVVEIGDKRFFVAEACTGVNSLFSILACTLFYVFYYRPSVVRGILLVLAGLVWVLLANVTRVILVVVLANKWKIDVADGWRHDLLGFALFAIALLLIWSTDRLFMTFASWRNKPSSAQGTPAPENKPEELSIDVATKLKGTWLSSPVAAGAFGLLLLLHLVFYALPHAFAVSPHLPDPEQLGKDSLPDPLEVTEDKRFFPEGWRRLDKVNDFVTGDTIRRTAGSAYGEYSKKWFYWGDSRQVEFLLDWPFSEWHPLQDCYTGQGWEVEKSEEQFIPAGEKGLKQDFHYSTKNLKKAGRKVAYLFFCEFDQAGQAFKPVTNNYSMTVAIARHKSAFNRLSGGRSESADRVQVGTLFQFQMLVESNAPLNSIELKRAHEAFRVAYQSLHKQLFSVPEQAEGPPK
jgi:exosortase